MQCLIIEDDLIMSNLLIKNVKEISFLNLNGTFENAQDALKHIATNNIDLIFLDIELPDMNGFDLIKKIADKNIQVIVVSSSESNALKGYKHNLTDFLLKPIDKTLFLEAIIKAKKVYDQGKSKNKINYDDTIFVKCGTSFHSIAFDEMLYIEAMGDYISVVTPEDRFMTHETMKDFNLRLPSEFFLRAHNSFIININKISKIEDGLVTIGTKMIPISRKYKQMLFEHLKI